MTTKNVVSRLIPILQSLKEPMRSRDIAVMMSRNAVMPEVKEIEVQVGVYRIRKKYGQDFVASVDGGYIDGLYHAATKEGCRK